MCRIYGFVVKGVGPCKLPHDVVVVFVLYQPPEFEAPMSKNQTVTPGKGPVILGLGFRVTLTMSSF